MARPENVRVVHPDGTEIPCELAHLGVDADGMDQWTVDEHTVLRHGDMLRIGVMPARTGIAYPGARP
jgi:hypothetical protein